MQFLHLFTIVNKCKNWWELLEGRFRERADRHEKRFTAVATLYYSKRVNFLVKQEKFEGPLALLLELIEKEKLAIAEVSLASVADSYLVYVRALVAPDPEEIAEFLVVAAHLMLIKSRSLLPSLALPAEEEAAIDNLEQRLALLQTIREAGRALHILDRRAARIASRDAYAGMAPLFCPPKALRPATLADVFAAGIALIPKPEKLAEEKLKRIVSLEEKIGALRGILQDAVERGFSEIMAGAREKVDIVVSFLALLELARQKFVDLRQDTHFAEIMIRKIT